MAAIARSGRLARRAMWIAAGAPAVLLVALLASHATDIPLRDDFSAVLGFLNRWSESGDWGERASLLVEQHYSHRIVATRLAALASTALFGACSFTLLQVAGWIGWMALFAGLIFASRRLRETPAAVVPLSLLLMQPQGFSNFVVGMQAIQNIGVVAVALAGVIFATRDGRTAAAGALACVVVAPFVSANGLVLGLVIVVLAAIDGRRRQALLTLVTALGAGGLYFLGYDNPQAPWNLGAWAANATVMLGAPFAPLRLEAGFALLVGSAIALAAVVVLTRRGLWREEPALMGFLLFAGLSVAMAARGRIGWGAEYMVQDRYKLYGLLVAGVLAGLLLPRWPANTRTIALPAAAILALGFAFVSYLYSWPKALNAWRWNEATAANRQLGVWFPQVGDTIWPEAVRELKRAEERGLYRLPEVLPSDEVAELQNPPPVSSTHVAMTMVPDGSLCGYRIEPATPATGNRLPDFALLRSPTREIVLPVLRPRARVADLLRRWSLLSASHGFVLPAMARPDGSFHVHAFRRGPLGLQLMETAFVPEPANERTAERRL